MKSHRDEHVAGLMRLRVNASWIMPSKARPRGGGVRSLCYDRYWGGEWGIVLLRCGGGHVLPSPWNVLLQSGAWSCNSGRSCLKPRALPMLVINCDPTWDFFISTAFPFMGSVSLRANLRIQLIVSLLNLHFLPGSPHLRSQACTSFDKYNSMPALPQSAWCNYYNPQIFTGGLKP